MYDALEVFKGDAVIPSSPTSLTTTHLTVFRCPSDLGVGQPVNAFRGGHATANYIGVVGAHDLDVLVATPPNANGMLFDASRIRFGSVTDGLSNTLLLGERRFENGTGGGGEMWGRLAWPLRNDGRRREYGVSHMGYEPESYVEWYELQCV